MWLTTLAALRLVATLGTHPVIDDEVGYLEVSWQCDAERAGRCHLDAEDGPRTIVVWFRSDAALSLQSAGIALHTFPGQEPRSAWARVEFPRGEGRLTLRAPSGRTVWALNVEPLPPEPAGLTAARKAFDRGALDRADAILGQAMPGWHDAADAGNTALTLDLRQRIAFREGRFTRGLRLAEQALTAYSELGWTTQACGLAMTLAVRHIDMKGDPAAADSILRRAVRCGYDEPGFAAEYQYLRARVAEMTGRWRDANASYRIAVQLAGRLQRHSDSLGYLASHVILADTLHDDVALASTQAQIERIERYAQLDVCEHASVWNNIGWTRLMRRQRGLNAPDPRPLFTRTLLAFEGPTACRSRRDAENVRINLALAELQADRHGEALGLLADIDLAGLNIDEAQWFHIAAIEARLAAGDLDRAAASVKALQRLAGRGRPRPEAAMHAAYHLGLLHQARGQPELALAAYAAADRARDELLLPLRLGSARERAAADWDLGVARTLKLLLDAGRTSEALCTVRAARRRSLRAAEQIVDMPPARFTALRKRFLELRQASAHQRSDDHLRSTSTRRERMALRRELDDHARSLLDDLSPDRERRACAALRSPEAGELHLFYYPIGDDLWMFARDDRKLRAHRVAFPRTSDPETVADALLGPFDDLLERAGQVRVYAAGPAAELDVHALPWHGSPLLTSVPVAYAVDPARPTTSSPGVAATLVVANPDHGLRRADAEAGAVLAAWRRLGLTPQRLDGDTGRQEVLDRLANSLVFHFVGHAGRADHVEPAPDPWNTELHLGDRSSISVDDVLVALPAAPAVVLLSACETGLVDAHAPGGGLSLASALVLRGASVVIASTRRVDDGESSELLQEFYRQAGDSGDLLDPALLSRAQVALLAGSSCEDRPDVCAFRAGVP